VGDHLPEVLNLLYGSGERGTTRRAAGEEWVDEDLEELLFATPEGVSPSYRPPHGEGPPGFVLGVPVGRPPVVPAPRRW
jgi:hypothetical protein